VTEPPGRLAAASDFLTDVRAGRLSPNSNLFLSLEAAYLCFLEVEYRAGYDTETLHADSHPVDEVVTEALKVLSLKRIEGAALPWINVLRRRSELPHMGENRPIARVALAWSEAVYKATLRRLNLSCAGQSAMAPGDLQPARAPLVQGLLPQRRGRQGGTAARAEARLGNEGDSSRAVRQHYWQRVVMTQTNLPRRVDSARRRLQDVASGHISEHHLRFYAALDAAYLCCLEIAERTAFDPAKLNPDSDHPHLAVFHRAVSRLGLRAGEAEAWYVALREQYGGHELRTKVEADAAVAWAQEVYEATLEWFRTLPPPVALP